MGKTERMARQRTVSFCSLLIVFLMEMTSHLPAMVNL